ncbi:unnamed protein product [Meganyctiphanes norvegica]|uniref:asparagine--tRNA ligase n=1 Tax=Meganyctiphanes norvegica TaxID=48144 RepID=A0AAV2QJA3_MEGNR
MWTGRNHNIFNFASRLRTTIRQSSRISGILQSKTLDDNIQIQGWVKAIRKQKEITFIDVGDGSSHQNLQVIVPTSKLPNGLGFHSCVSAAGILKSSDHPNQEVELIAQQVKLHGATNQTEYPFKARKKHTLDYIRQHVHYRSRTNTFSSLLRVRSQAKYHIQDYFNQEGFHIVDTPILTSNDCEGGSEVFVVQPGPEKSKSSFQSEDKSYFNKPVYLTVSGQLHLEAMASGLSKVYNFNPAFRAENSQSRRHLCEFWMVEAEESFLQGLEGLQALMNRIEDLLKHTMRKIVELQPEDIFFHWKQNPETENLVKLALEQKFLRINYQEAMNILLANNSSFKTKADYGKDLGKEHELFLTQSLGNIPIFVTDWPKDTKAFYMATREDQPNTALGVDLLLPGVGEVAGGGLREYRTAVLEKKLIMLDLQNSLDWYLDLRRNGCAPSGGFGLGFERFLQFLLGTPNIKDTIPFPRWAKHCSC